jgi:hypothetical protein
MGDKMRGHKQQSDKHSLLTKARLISAFACAVTAFLGWYFSHCYEERKDAIPEFKAAFADSRSAHNQMRASMVVALGGTYLLVGYLKGKETVDLRVVQQRHSQLISLYQDAETECNKVTEALNRYADAQDTISKVFLIQSDRRLVVERSNHLCVLWSDMRLRLMWYDPTKLSVKRSRDEFVAEMEQQRDAAEKVTEYLDRDCADCAKLMDDELKYAESRRFSVMFTCWDCTRRLFKQF